jgi:hypothetical protein
MMVPRTVAEVLSEHVTLEVECIDRMYLNVYVPALQFPAGVACFLKNHRKHAIASTVLLDPIGKAFISGIKRFVDEQHVPLIDFHKGQRKDDITQEHLAHFDRLEGVLYVGRAQEKASVCRTEKRRNPFTGKTYPWIVKSSALVNHFYFYAVDDDFGPFFLKFCSYFPYNAKLCINGNEWAKRQAAKAGIAFEPLDNGFATCDDPRALQRICDRLGASHIDRLLRKWLARLPHPFEPRDRRSGYRYDVSILQAEFSLTQTLDRPLAGRVFFEEVIRENLDIGRPDRISLVFDRHIITRGRNATPGRFRTRVLNEHVTPSLHVEYKNTHIKQYHKEGRALRTETTINDSRDFRIGRRLHNLPKLREIGFAANRRLLDAERLEHDPIIGEQVFEQVSRPVELDGQRAPALCFGDRRVHALLAAIVIFRLQTRGFTNRELRDVLAPLLGLLPGQQVSVGRMTYDLRRLRLHGIVERIPRSHRYHVTPLGWSVALFFARAYDRFIRPGLSDIADQASTGPLRQAVARFDAAMQRHLTKSGLAA